MVFYHNTSCLCKLFLQADATSYFQNKSMWPHQVLEVEGQGFKLETAGIVQLFKENCPLNDRHPCSQHRWLHGIWTNYNTLINISDRHSISILKLILCPPLGFRLSDVSTMSATQQSRRKNNTTLRKISRDENLRAMLWAVIHNQ